MSSYSIGADSPRWWWPSAAAGAVGAAAIAAIVVLPADGTPSPEPVLPHDPPPPAVGPWSSTIDPGTGPQCFRLLPRGDGTLDNPRCGRRSVRWQWPSVDGLRPGLDANP